MDQLGFCDDIRVLAENSKTVLRKVIPVDIREESEEDEALQKALKNSMNDAFDIGRPFDGKKENFTQFEMVEMDDFVNKVDNFSDFERKENEKLMEIDKIKEAVNYAISDHKIIIKLHSLQRLQKNLTQIFQKFSDENTTDL